MAGLTAEDELAIRNLVSRYADSVSRRDLETWASTWAEDCHWDLGRATARGRDEVLAVLRSAFDRHSWLLSIAITGEVFEGDERGVRGVWYVLELQQVAEEEARLVVGRYEDTYVRESNRWVFLERRFQPTYRSEPAPAEMTPVIAALVGQPR